MKLFNEYKARPTYYLDVSNSGPHRIRVDLAHVPSPVVLLDVCDVQIPGAVVVEGQRNAGVLGDDVVVDGQNCLRVHSHPRNL